MHKVKPEDNPADILTKFVGSDTLNKHTHMQLAFEATAVSHSVRSMLNNSCAVHMCVSFATYQPTHLQSFRVGT